jgi:FKBP-type peptidyl-prolyl cis-trans isomerase 2
MRVKRNRVVSIHYRRKLDSGEEVDTSQRRGPLTFLVGHGQMIPGLENEFINMEVGDKKNVRVEPKDGYGLVNEALVQSIDREATADENSHRHVHGLFCDVPQPNEKNQGKNFFNRQLKLKGKG